MDISTFGLPRSIHTNKVTPLVYQSWSTEWDVKQNLRYPDGSLFIDLSDSLPVSYIFPGLINSGRKEMFYLTTHSTHFIYGYMVSDIW